MSGTPVTTLRVEVEREEVFRYLGYPAGKPRSPATVQRVEELWPALALLHPRGALRLVDRPAAIAAGMPEPAARVCVAACTIGAELEAEAARRSDAGALLDALILDAIGSAAAEAAADALNLRLCHKARTLGLVASPRVSPGYGSWDTARQGDLLALLPIAELGIRLTSGQMMVPRKSVSFAASLDRDTRRGDRKVSPCVRCGLQSCRHRMTAGAGPVGECG